jgi:hypothetical protein
MAEREPLCSVCQRFWVVAQVAIGTVAVQYTAHAPRRRTDDEVLSILKTRKILTGRDSVPFCASYGSF